MMGPSVVRTLHIWSSHLPPSELARTPDHHLLTGLCLRSEGTPVEDRRALSQVMAKGFHRLAWLQRSLDKVALISCKMTWSGVRHIHTICFQQSRTI